MDGTIRTMWELAGAKFEIAQSTLARGAKRRREEHRRERWAKQGRGLVAWLEQLEQLKQPEQEKKP